MPPKTIEEYKDAFIHFLMGVHGFTKQGEDIETQQCIDEAVAWFDELITTLRKETEEVVEKWRKSIDEEGQSCANKIEEAYEKGYGRGLEVGELQDKEAIEKAYQKGKEDAYGEAAKVVNELV